MDKKIDIDEVMKKDINLLTMDELKARLKEVEKKGTIQTKSGDSELASLGPDDLVYISVPSSPLNEPYSINENLVFYPGKHQVKLRVARQLQYMISESWKIERERLVSRSSHLAGAMLRGEQFGKIERFQQIMAED